MVDVDFLILGLKTIQAEGASGLLVPGVAAVCVDRVPCRLDLVAAYRIRVPWRDAGRFTLVEFDVVEEHGMSVCAPGVPKPLDIVCINSDNIETPGEDGYTVRYQALPLLLSSPGTYSVLLYLDRQEATRCALRVSLKPAAQWPEAMKRADITSTRPTRVLLPRV